MPPLAHPFHAPIDPAAGRPSAQAGLVAHEVGGARQLHQACAQLARLRAEVGWLEQHLAEQPGLRARCQGMRALIDQVVDGIGCVTAELQQAGVQGLWARLSAQVADFTERSGLVCQSSVDIAPGLPEPDSEHACAIFVIFGEMLGNVARHAQAAEVLIRVRATPGDLTLLVRDKGRGAPPSAFEGPDARGVTAMRERAALHGGWLQIDSQPGQGTQVILSMPLDRAVARPRLTPSSVP